MSLLDYYRQFEGMSEEEVNAGLRVEAEERRRKALTRVDTLDLSQTTWPELPNPRIVNAITFVARRGLHRYPHLRGSELREELAASLGVEPARLILGNGSAELLSSAARALRRTRPATADHVAVLSAFTRSWRAARTARPCLSAVASISCSRPRRSRRRA